MQIIANAIESDNIPAELQSVRQAWVCWLKEPRYAGGEPTKMPSDPRTGWRAKSNDPATHTDFHIAIAALEASDRYQGIAFMLFPPFLGVDLDDCRDSITGAIEPLAMEIITSMNTYGEISPSGCGVKMIGRGVMPTPDERGKNYRRDPWKTGKGGIEFYQHGRMFCLTGQHLAGTPATLSEITEPLAELYRKLYPPAPPRPVVRTDFAGEAARIIRCAKYLDKVPASISGQGGHDRLLHAACVAVRFGLDDGSALDLLHRFNQRAVPSWNERDIERKLSEARKLAGNEAGNMLLNREVA